MFSIGFSITILIFTLLLAGVVILPYVFGAPWHPTSPAIVRRILKFCDAEPGQSLYDLGSGDGRVLMIGVQEFGLKGVGLEIDPIKVVFSRWRIQRAGMDELIQVHRQNIYDFDYANADILYIYMTHQALDKLIPEIRKSLKPTVKIVCYRFCIRGMEPEKVNEERTIFLYTFNKGMKLNAFT